MAYVDGYLLPVPKKNLKKYARIAATAGKVWRDLGALDYYECVEEDITPGFGLPFPKIVKPKKGEVIVFSFIVYKNRKHRDKVNAAVMKDKRLANLCKPGAMPFDVKRMSVGGFKPLVALPR